MKDVTAYSCVCIACQGPALLFKALVAFQHWEQCCPRVSELLEDVNNTANPFSPSLQTLADVLLCPVDSETGFHQKECCYGDCKNCGWEKTMTELAFTDADMLVSFEAYEDLRHTDKIVLESKQGDFTVGQKKSSWPCLIKQHLSPSLFLADVFAPQFAQYIKHR